jgi:hypothetical protein
MNNQFDDNDYWKGVILYGLNQATYKIALGKSLIELTSLNKEVIDWSELSKSFFDNYIDRFKNEHLPGKQAVADHSIAFFFDPFSC